MPIAADNAAASFRIRDLPEELQLHIIRLCLPKWSFHLARRAHHVCKAEANTYKQELRYVARRSVSLPSSLFLVDKQMQRHVRQAAKFTFTGQLYTEYLAAETKSWKLNSDCTCLQPEDRRAAKKYALRNALNQITAVNCGISGSANFDRDLFRVLPNLRTVVVQLRKQLFDGYIYGFGSEELLIRYIADTSITKLVMSQLETDSQIRVLREFRAANISPVVELQVDVGRSTMSFSFMVVCVIEKADTGRIEMKVLQRRSMREWHLVDNGEYLGRLR